MAIAVSDTTDSPHETFEKDMPWRRQMMTVHTDPGPPQMELQMAATLFREGCNARSLPVTIPNGCRMALAIRSSNWSVENELLNCGPALTFLV